MKKILYIVLLLSASLIFASNYPDILNFSPANGSFQVEYSPRLKISFLVTNNLLTDDSVDVYVNGMFMYDALGVSSASVDNSIFGFSEDVHANSPDASHSYSYISISNVVPLHDGMKINVVVVSTSNNNSLGALQTNTFWFVLKDTTPPTITFLDKNDNSFDDSQIYSYVVPVKIVGQDNSGEDVICYYTLDGSDPTTHSACFTNLKILNLGQSAIIKVLAKDLSGNFSLVESKTINVESVTHANVNIKLYSQIIENNNLKIYFPEKDRYTIKIYDIQGNQIYQKEKEFGPDNDFIGISENLNLPHGIFIVKIVDSKNKTKTFRIAVK